MIRTVVVYDSMIQHTVYCVLCVIKRMHDCLTARHNLAYVERTE